MIRQRRRKCCHCGKLYDPDPRNRYHQRYCSDPACGKASKAASQKRWLDSPKGKDYFKGPINTQRVRDWRKDHPGYGKNRSKTAEVLQDHCPAQQLVPKADKQSLTSDALQDVFQTQSLLITGLVVLLTGSALQDDIDSATRRLIGLGQQIQSNRSCAHDNPQTCIVPPAATAGAATVQLDRPSPGTG